MSSTDCPSPRSSTKAESSALTKVAYTPVGWAGHRFRSRVSNEGSPRWLSGCDRPVSHPLPEAETTGDRRRRPPTSTGILPQGRGAQWHPSGAWAIRLVARGGESPARGLMTRADHVLASAIQFLDQRPDLRREKLAKRRVTRFVEVGHVQDHGLHFAVWPLHPDQLEVLHLHDGDHIRPGHFPCRQASLGVGGYTHRACAVTGVAAEQLI